MTLVLRHRVEQLVEQWDSQHADWCCTRGCAAAEGRHVPTDALMAWLDRLDSASLPLPTEPCSGECSCHVGEFISQLRAALEPTPDEARP